MYGTGARAACSGAALMRPTVPRPDRRERATPDGPPRAARAALEASDSTVLTDAQWQHVDDVLAAFLPDFGRAEQESKVAEYSGKSSLLPWSDVDVPAVEQE